MSFYGFIKRVIKLYYHTFYRIKIVGEENIASGAYVICPNHKSLNDPPLIGTCLNVPMRFMAKAELFENPFIGAVLKALGAFPVKRGKSDLTAVKTAVATVAEGKNLVIFPEGTRSPKNAVYRGKPGAALIAAKAGVDIVPVGIRGGYRIFSRVIVEIGKPISMSDYFGQRLKTAELQRITDDKLMPKIAELAGGLPIEERPEAIEKQES